MIVAIDTNILGQAFSQIEMDMDCLYVAMNVGWNDSICHDHENIIRQEYYKSLGASKMFKKWYQRLKQRKAIYFCDGHLDKTHKDRLSLLGCHKESDHTFVSVALNSDQVLLTEDRHFGKGPKGKQPPHSDAYRYLTDSMGIDVYDAQEAVEQLEERKLKQQLKELDQERVLEVLAENPEMVTLLEPDIRGNILGLQFERVVRDYLQRLGYVAEQGIYIDGFPDDIDVYAERDNEILICECQMRLDPSKSISRKKVDQIVDRLEFLRGVKPSVTITAWVASTSDWLEDDVNQWDTIESYGGAIQVMHFPLRGSVLRRIGEQNVVALLREVWFEDSEVKQITRP